MKLLTINNRKTIKGQKMGWLTGILHLAPFNLSGRNVCPFASIGCAKACLNTAGFGRYKNVQDARIDRTRLFWDNRNAFLALLELEIKSFERKAARDGLKLAIRLNGTSDIVWERYGIIQRFPHVQFYDYSKIPKRFIGNELPANYHLTFSRSESNGGVAELIASMGHNVAVVFKELPKLFFGKRVINGDDTDLRFLDPKGVVIGLTAKGRGKWDKTGFVVGNEIVAA